MKAAASATPRKKASSGRISGFGHRVPAIEANQSVDRPSAEPAALRAFRSAALFRRRATCTRRLRQFGMHVVVSSQHVSDGGIEAATAIRFPVSGSGPGASERAAIIGETRFSREASPPAHGVSAPQPMRARRSTRPAAGTSRRGSRDGSGGARSPHGWCGSSDRSRRRSRRGSRLGGATAWRRRCPCSAAASSCPPRPWHAPRAVSGSRSAPGRRRRGGVEPRT